MRVLGLTGGIATGKSTALRLFQKHDARLEFFDADACVAMLYNNEEVLLQIQSVCGEEVVRDGVLNRDLVRQMVFKDRQLREDLQAVIHPLVRKECLASLASAVTNEASSFIADVPLLFESGFDFGQDANLVVAVSVQTQKARLKMRSGFDDATVQAILEAQLPISQKEKCADVVLWNEGSCGMLEMQIKRCISNHYE